MGWNVRVWWSSIDAHWFMLRLSRRGPGIQRFLFRKKWTGRDFYRRLFNADPSAIYGTFATWPKMPVGRWRCPLRGVDGQFVRIWGWLQFLFLLRSMTYAVRFCTFGRAIQQTSITTKAIMTIGCKTTVPNFWARIPVMSGPTAPPLLPIAAMKLKLLICMFRGNSLLNIAVAQGIGNEPDQELESKSASNQPYHCYLFTNLMRRMWKHKSTDSDTPPEACCHITNSKWITMTISDQEWDDPARDWDFRPLICENE